MNWWHRKADHGERTISLACEGGDRDVAPFNYDFVHIFKEILVITYTSMTSPEILLVTISFESKKQN
jgi:hypothetical protein